ncbi:MAG: VTT domain-containing protein [Chloroflexota bacterium]
MLEMDRLTKEQVKDGIAGWLKTSIIPILILILVLAITVALFLFARHSPEAIAEIERYGYWGVFIICLISNTSIILPVPGIFLVLPLVTTLNPVLVGLVGSTGGAIGEITGYIAGYSGRKIVKRNQIHWRVEGWMKKWGAWIIFIFAFVPALPFDITGIVAGTVRYPVWKFILVCWVGKTIKYIILALAFAWGLDTILRLFGTG